MNRKQLQKLGVPPDCVKPAVQALTRAAQEGEGFGLKGKRAKLLITDVLGEPRSYVDDPVWGELAKELLADAEQPTLSSIDYRTWGDDIDDAAHAQMRQACRVPSAVGAALMPDAHVGYGLPIGGVLACENAVIPYAVGVDIACRMKLSVLDLPVEALANRRNSFKEALTGGTRFGVGVEHRPKQQHDVLDRDWGVSRITREKKDTAWRQLGTSGSGNHFVEFGELTLDQCDDELGLDAGAYVALLSHSGSRGPGAAVCSTYSAVAQRMLPRRFADLGRLAWLSLDSSEGQEYWAAMNLMGEYAAANHAVIHRLVTNLLGAHIVAGVENHHNFAWKEFHNGRELVVHRKGATPAAAGELGVIPGSMADPAFVVRGRGEPASFCSASHGAGRRMSRKQAKDTYRFNAVKGDLAKRGVDVLAAGTDEAPGVYKDIRQVMAAQQDLVDVVARFDPKIVRMCGDGSRAED
ncbi:RNA-splicing ligase RtcB [Posidoniimonas corsicana]|uniref:3'-phosphate/5'-hydroxy nucleic acid ligase n=1 Tax=Posidoniimonas corsicana TaxID=1938618 RepID=A0A5C5V545_9BACT|nr:RtcB family protein [Posidoniimonas corsicana]TWT33658.1 RNA-splicing ligase RtcB [Posidoniimonas corsicana]